MNVSCVGPLRILDAFSLQARMDLLSTISYAGTMIMSRSRAVTSALDIIFVDTSHLSSPFTDSQQKSKLGKAIATPTVPSDAR